jgi:modulator of FtsH protease
VVPLEFQNFFIASAGAAAALAGLLFVAASLAPEQSVTRRAPVERQAVAGSAFTALINAFFISLAALVPHFNFGTFVVPISAVSLVTSLLQAWSLLRPRKGWPSFLRRAIMVVVSLGLYLFQLRQGIGLIAEPAQVGFVYGTLFLIMGTFGLGLIRAWELLGAQRYGLGGWLNPLRDVGEE